MISKECFVYIQLPNSHETVTIGRLEWQSKGANTELGRFVYGRKYLSNESAFPLDPFQLPLEERTFDETKNDGLHGPLRDASPDAWGRYVIQKNTPKEEHDQIGYLLNSAGDRIGALSFGLGKVPPAPIRSFNKTVDLGALIKAAHKLEEGEPLEEVEKKLLMNGPSAGGARPKTTVEHENALWIAKFPAASDKQNFSRIEYATMKLAEHCGLNVPEVRLTQVGDQDVFLIKRFDRSFDPSAKNYFRTHFVSGLTVMNQDEKAYDSWSYLDLADQMRRWAEGKPSKDLEELYRRLVFNGLVSNTDDHARNHGFLKAGKGFRLSPVYDLVPKPETGSIRYLAMQVGARGREFTMENAVSRSDAFDLTKQAAEDIFKELKSKIGKWRPFYAGHGVATTDLDYLDGAFGHWEFLGA